jgi:WD40 repeat protein
VGLWSIDESKVTAKEGVYRFRVHGRPVTCLEWIVSGKGLLSASYDGSVRWLDVEAQKFSQVFAMYVFLRSFRTRIGLRFGTRTARVGCSSVSLILVIAWTSVSFSAHQTGGHFMSTLG